MNFQNIQNIQQTISTLEQSMTELKAMLSSLTLQQKAEKPEQKAEKAEQKAQKAEKAEQSEANIIWNALIASTMAEMKQNGWTTWADVKTSAIWPSSRSATINGRSAFVYDGGEHDGKEPTRPLGGMSRSSYIKSQTVVVKAEQVTAPSAKKAGRPKMTAEQKAAKTAKTAKKAEEPVAVTVAEQPVKKAGRPKMTAEQKATAAVKRATAKAKAESDNENIHTCSDMPGEWAEMLGGKKLDLSFYPFTYEGESLIMNDRGDVLEPVEGVWVGSLKNGILDRSVAEPLDLQEPVMRD